MIHTMAMAHFWRWQGFRLSLVIALATAWPAHGESSSASAGLQPNDIVAICGDSITEHKLYSVLMESYLLMCQPEPGLGVNQFGWSGETSWGFVERIENDVLPFQPSVATICYGMNDAHYRTEGTLRLKKFREATTAAVKALKAGGVRFIVLGAPGVVDTDSYKKGNPAEVNQILSGLGDTAREIAAKEGVAFADLHNPMMKAMALAKARYGQAYHVAGIDGVHPAINGHLIMAYAFLKALQCDGNIGQIILDFSSGQATTDIHQKILKSSPSGIELESARYPFCFSGDPKDPGATTGMLDFISFNQDLNRYILIVKNAPSTGLSVTWGQDTKTFSAADLERGVNLAAEFPENPFSAPFAAIQAAIKTRQMWDTTAVKTLLHPMLEWNTSFPEEKETMQRLAEKVLKKSRGQRLAIDHRITPVKHFIKLEKVR